MSRNKILLVAVAALSSSLMAQPSGWPPSPDHLTLQVWPGAAPGAPTNLPPEGDLTTPKDNLIAGRPLLHWSNVVMP
ncbi:MAG TPA: hypothetical protein VMV39_00660, partial [Terracidiphilus sp.]|nr:hypothetical protein [Terracidiphilus sp.]